MTDNPQLAAWMAARDAAELVCLRKRDIPIDEGSPFERGLHAAFDDAADAIRALPPPDFAAWQPPPEGEREDTLRQVIAYHERAALILCGPGMDREAKEQMEKHRTWASVLSVIRAAPETAP